MKAHEFNDAAVVAVSQVGRRVVWNKERGEFDLQPVPPAPAKLQALASSSRASPEVIGNFSSSGSLATALSRFTVDQFRSEASFDDLQTTRSQLQQRVLSSDSPMRWLPGFVATWSSLLAFFSERVATTDQSFVASLADEFLEIAHTLESMGEIHQARAHLGKCIALVHPHQYNRDRGKEPVAVFEDAKKALFTCIKFQESLAKCQHLLLRAKTPPQILAFLVREVELLSSQAPFSVQLLMIKTDLHWKSHQYTAIVSSLSTSSLTSMDVRLTLLYVRALETQGLYQQSLAVASQWLTSNNVVGDQDDLPALLAHNNRLTMLLATKSNAEQLQREENYDEALHCYSHCLKLLGSSSNRSFHALLLLNRASVTLMLVGTSTPASTSSSTTETTRLSGAIDDLTLSLKLNPSNQLTKLRLNTALLQLETQKLKSRMKMTE
ncbi:Methionine synthase reductase [Globisporangium polare]